MISLPVIALRLALALILGGIIGLERELNEQRAGVRTNALVSLGSALFTIISAYGFLGFLSLKGVQVDPSRVASYVVAGIGFLGAGAIVVRRGGARGLTTAAAIWMVAAIGMTCGIGFYWEAVVAGLLTLVVLSVLRLIEKRLLPEQLAAVLQLRLSPDQAVEPVMAQVSASCAREGLTIETLRSYKVEEREVLELRCRLERRNAALRVLAGLRNKGSVDEGKLDLQDKGR